MAIDRTHKGKDFPIKKEIRYIPNPPSFNKIAARSMDPKTGASTWALGSHRCIVYIGNFTKNTSIVLKITMVLILSELCEAINDST